MVIHLCMNKASTSTIRSQSATLTRQTSCFWMFFDSCQSWWQQTHNNQILQVAWSISSSKQPCSRKQPNSWRMRCMTWSSSILVRWQNLWKKWQFFWGQFFGSKKIMARNLGNFTMLLRRRASWRRDRICAQGASGWYRLRSRFLENYGLYKGNLEQRASGKDIGPGLLGSHFTPPSCFEMFFVSCSCHLSPWRWNKNE